MKIDREEMIKDLWTKFPWIPTGQELDLSGYIISQLSKQKAEHEAVVGDLTELLEKCESVFDDMDSITWNEDSGWQQSSYDDVADEVREKLEILKNVGE